ncbi:MAG: helix-turn-helix transcriptional regulator [Clostridiales bacterium]|nr:helix-turn-helix transcriptional regulator [Clostridiales bacterium]
MIIYDKLWETMRSKGISQNKLYKEYGVSRAQIDRLKHNRTVYTSTLDMLCGILGCDDISDVVTYIPDGKKEDPNGE